MIKFWNVNALTELINYMKRAKSLVLVLSNFLLLLRAVSIDEECKTLNRLLFQLESNETRDTTIIEQ